MDLDTELDVNAESNYICAVCGDAVCEEKVFECFCGTTLCQSCTDFAIFKDNDEHCYNAAEFNDFGGYEIRCFKCLIKTPQAWCRNVKCECKFNICTMMEKVFKKDLLRDGIPGGDSFLKTRREAYERVLRTINHQDLQKLTIPLLQNCLSTMNVYFSKSLKKPELVQRVQQALDVEEQFFENKDK